ncbi:MAG: patatin-like phospholipase family protein [Beijerinckiaceae bacterium]
MLFEGMARRAFGGSGGGRAAEENLQPPGPELARPKLGLALGSGAARGWSHIGVLQAFAEAKVEIDVIAGTSIGAVVAGCHAAGVLPELESFARGLTRAGVVGLMDINIKGSGLIAGNRLRKRLERHLSEILIDQLPIPFTAIATELATGHEIWLTHGRLVDALCASYALPGIFSPVRLGGRWLMDGALVNPVPVTAARALGADIVVAVNLNGDVPGGKGTVIHSYGAPLDQAQVAESSRGLGWQMADAANWMNPFARRGEGPSLAGVMVDAFNITQDRISRSRLAGDPPDLMIAPRVGRIGLFEFQRAADAIEAGREAAQRALEDVRVAIGQAAEAG